MAESHNQAVREILGLDASEKFNAVSIQVASPETIHSWSRGEVKNPETINYRTFKPEKGGLFCEKIFGPTKDWECACGKYKRVKHKGIVCDRCGVEVTHSRVRRERMAHIDLAVPVTHVWFFKCMPTRLGMLVGMTARNLERVIYYESYIVIDPGNTPLVARQLLTDEEYRESIELYGDAFKAGMGADALREILGSIDLPELQVELTDLMANTGSKAERQKIAKRLRLVEGFIESDMRPEWMVMTVIPVIPPDLRPLVPLEGGRFATSDLNDLYRRVINRNNRLKNLLSLRTPEVIIRNEKRMLQEAVDALFDNGRHGRAVTGAGNRPLKSLSDMLKGKQGRFRQNLLGKRVDYSGRSVIVVGPELRLNQCGLPKKMALTLFEPFIIRRLKELGYVHTVRSAKKMIERGETQVWDILEEVTKGHPIMLNRAPTLHRLSIQAFDPVLIEGNAIRIHPLVCSAYNADFDGDQMAVHVPLSNEAQLEAKLLMLSARNIFYPSNGQPICVPTQDITLGSYFLTYEVPNSFDQAKDVKTFSDIYDAVRAFDAEIIGFHDVIEINNPDFGVETIWGNKDSRRIKTTAGRCIFNQVWPAKMGFCNKTAGSSVLGKLVSSAYQFLGRAETVDVLDSLKAMGYKYATRAGFSIGITDMIIPEEKAEIIADAEAQVEEVRERYNQGSITNQERYNQCIDIWTNANEKVANATFHVIERNEGRSEINPVWGMLDSKARGSKNQIRQLAGMRGLMAKPSGDIIERPIISNFREGLSVLEFFISSHGARKGLADTALKTADSGYMTRKLVDVAHDVICVEYDCMTTQGIYVSAIREGDNDVLPLQDRVVGRFSADDIRNPVAEGDDDAYIVKAGEEIDARIADQLVENGVERVLIRSVLTCRSHSGVCAKCYGRNLANDSISRPGDSIGIVAAQSIGEPGTQLTMRTFHVGGVASSQVSNPFFKARTGGILKLEDARTVEDKDGNIIVLNKLSKAILLDDDGYEQESFELVAGAVISSKIGDKIKKNQEFVRWDPYNLSIISEHTGTVEFVDLVEGITIKEEINEGTGQTEITVLEHRDDLFPQVKIVDADGHMLSHYNLPVGAYIMVEDGQTIDAGSALARTPRQSSKTTDITGGLPRIAELFEARKPKDAAEIARIDGKVEMTPPAKGKRKIIIHDMETGSVEEHVISASKYIVVYDGEMVKKGQPLTGGSVLPHEILEVCGPQDLQEYLVNQIQGVYRGQGVEINDKHIEVIVCQMLQKVKVLEPGDTDLLYGEQIDKQRFLDENAKTLAVGGRPAEAQPVLLGITKAALETDSFISAASFQDTTRILTDAATLGKIDPLKGFKENVIMGHLIPAGTGYSERRTFDIKRLGKEIVPDISEMVSEGAAEEADAEAQSQADALAGLGLDVAPEE
ncbi:MAG: DNA-directed RNA polymerase subunit beta' [Lentisphaeria bacterium]|nr:DNA-directed RNA polymerase subunit beta' [Lentisphaeria bacterium]